MNKSFKTILLVEDEAPIRTVVKDRLSQEGFKVIEAQNGQEALGAIAQTAPDLIFLDVIMPKMHGIELLKKLQTTKESREIPVVLLTNYSEDPRVIEAVKEGRCELLSKQKVKIEDVVAKAKEKLAA